MSRENDLVTEDYKKRENEHKVKKKKKVNVSFVNVQNIHLLGWFVNGFEIADFPRKCPFSHYYF